VAIATLRGFLCSKGMVKKQYYSIRTGKIQDLANLNLESLLELFGSAYRGFERKGYFREYLSDHIQHESIDVYIYRHVHKLNLWPIDMAYENQRKKYSEEDLFDIIEFLYDNVSKELGRYGGYHRELGRKEFRSEINDLLRYYPDGYEISEEGEILRLPSTGLEYLLETAVPEIDPENVTTKIEAAIRKFRSFRSSLDDRRDAIHSLAAVFEFIRKKLKHVLSTKDENDLFNIANNFAIRHHNDEQKTNYDKKIWLDWMFYFYLATMHASLELIKKKEETDSVS